MPTIATGVNNKVAYKKETTWGTAASATGAKYLRRVSADFNLTKETYQSEEMRTDYQVTDFRHGVRRAEGSLNGEFSAGSYADFFAAALRRDFTAATLAGASITVTVTGSVYKLVRASGPSSFLTDGWKVGMVVRCTGLTKTDDNGKNLLVAAVSALEVTVVPLDGSTLTALGPTAVPVTFSVPGKVTYVPSTGHTDNSFTVEQFFSDIQQSEVYTGMKVNSVGVSIPATGMTTVDFGFMGKNLDRTGTTQYFTTPTAAGSTGIFAGVNGVVVYNGAPIAVITDASVNINSDMTDAVVLGSNSISDVFEGRVTVDGSMSVYFQDATFRDAFKDETEVSIVFALTASNDKAADFATIALPRVKLGSFSKADAMDGIIASCDFTALLQGTNTAGKELTTVMIQDSQAA